MARINFHDEVYKDPNYGPLLLDVGDVYRTKGLLITAWELAQVYWLKHQAVPAEKWPDELLVLVKHKFAKEEHRASGVFFYVSGSKEHCSFLDGKSAGGKKGGKSRNPKKLANLRQGDKTPKHARNTPETAPKLTESSYSYSPSSSFSNSDSRSENLPDGSADASPPAPIPFPAGGKVGPTVTAPAWLAYSSAYREKYGAEPKRNATVNSQMANFVKRIGEAESPQVLRFYLEHNDAFYGRSLHPIGLALKDAEKLHTEWITGAKQTSTRARQQEKFQAASEQMKRLEEGRI